MGLAEQKTRLVFGADPRNRNWSDDKGRFGFKMLEKMGWSEGKGLGANEDGVKEHVKIKLKTNNFGVGAEKKNIRNWLANADGFSELLNRLNSESTTQAETSGEKQEEGEEEKTKKKKEKKEKKKGKKESPDNAVEPVEAKDMPTQQVISAASARLSRLSHRAKFRQMKQMATKDAKGLQEIFGVRSNPSYEDTPTATEPVSTAEQSGSSTPKTNTIETGVSVSDYFAKKMMDNPALAAIYGGATAAGSKRESASSQDGSDSDVDMEPPSKKSKSEKPKDSKKDKRKKDRKDKKSKEEKKHKDKKSKEDKKSKKSSSSK